MNDKMSRYNKKMDTHKFPYDKLVVSLRETGGFLTRNLKLLTGKKVFPNWEPIF